MESVGCEVVRRLVEEVANGGRMTLIDELVAGDFREHAGPPGLPSDREVLKQDLAFRNLFRNGITFEIVKLRSQDGLVTLVLREDNGRPISSIAGDHPHPSPLPSRERGLEPYPVPSGNEECRVPMTEDHRIRVVEGKISEHWGVKPLFSTPRH